MCIWVFQIQLQLAEIGISFEGAGDEAGRRC